MNVQMIWNGTNHDWFKTDKAHKLDENVYVFNKNNGRKRSFEKKKYIKIQHESFKYQMNVFYLWEDHSIQWILFLFYSRFKIEMHVKKPKKRYFVSVKTVEVVARNIYGEITTTK